MTEFFRAGVGAILRDPSSGRVVVFERTRLPGAWQFLQGGIEAGEKPIAAVIRELLEEVGLSQTDVRLISEHERWLTYELPVELRNAKTGRGQTQRWHLFDLCAEPDAAFAFDRAESPEFRAWRWTTPREAAIHAVAFRRSVYDELATWTERHADG